MIRSILITLLIDKTFLYFTSKFIMNFFGYEFIDINLVNESEAFSFFLERTAYSTKMVNSEPIDDGRVRVAACAFSRHAIKVCNPSDERIAEVVDGVEAYVRNNEEVDVLERLAELARNVFADRIEIEEEWQHRQNAASKRYLKWLGPYRDTRVSRCAVACTLRSVRLAAVMAEYESFHAVVAQKHYDLHVKILEILGDLD